MKALHTISFILLLIGGLNWGIYGATSMGTNVVHSVLGGAGWLEMLVYILVGVAALVEIFTHKHNCKSCDNKSMPQQAAM